MASRKRKVLNVGGYVVKGFKYPGATPRDYVVRTERQADKIADDHVRQGYSRPPIYKLSERQYKALRVGGTSVVPGVGMRAKNPKRRRSNPSSQYAPAAKKFYQVTGLGSVSSGTLRDEDLFDAFVSELALFNKTKARQYQKDWDKEGGAEGEFASEIVVEVGDVLNNVYAPPYVYFGSHEGDAADFGWWPTHDAVEDGIRDGTILRLDAGDSIPKNLPASVEAIAFVSDHGNLTLTDRKGRVFWTIV